MMEWRDTEIIPLYNRAGVIKRIFHQPSLPGTTVETDATPEPEAPSDLSYKMVRHEGSGLPMARHVAEPPQHRPVFSETASC